MFHFKKHQHLRKTADFKNVQTNGLRFTCPAFVLYFLDKQTSGVVSSLGIEGRKQDSGVIIDNLSLDKTIICPHLACKQRYNTLLNHGRRLGVVASRKVGPAVKRNKGKRWIRECFRLNQEVLPKDCDIVIILRSSFDKYSFVDLVSFYLKNCKRAGNLFH